MSEYELERTQAVPRPAEDVFAFFSDARNLEAITPAWLRFEILEAPERLEDGSLLRYRLHLVGVPVRWRTAITTWQPPHTFHDVQLSGPYHLWEHTNRFSPTPWGTEIYDHVRYSIPGGPLASLVQHAFVARRLDEIFDYRADRVSTLLR